MKGKKITGAAILLFAGLALALYFLKKDPLREVHALWEETMSRTEGAYVQTVTGSAWETKDAPGGRVLLYLPGSAEGLRWNTLSEIEKPGSGCTADFTSDGQKPLNRGL